MSERLMRFKRRYILVETSAAADFNQIAEAVKACFIELYGKTGLAESGLKRVRSSKGLILSCYKEWVPRLILAFSLVRSVEKKDLVLKTVKISGTVKGVLKSVGKA